MSDDWIEVTGRRSFKRDNNRRNRNINIRESSSEPDENRVQKNFERITKEIQNVYYNSAPFLSKLLKDLKSKINSNKLLIYALGCGTVENTSMVLAKSCLYQWAVCILLVHFLKPISVHIFDPVMSKTDYLVWNKLTNFEFKFKKTDHYFNEDLHSSLSSSPVSFLLSSTNSSSSLVQPSTLTSHPHSSQPCNIILWMPHCEKFLYKAVLDGILQNKSPLKVSQSLSHSDESNKFNELDDSTNLLSLENTILVGNSLSDYSLTDLTFKDSFSLSETSLLPFDLHSQSFNDTFITTFSKLQ